jgi:hypothetical protein
MSRSPMAARQQLLDRLRRRLGRIAAKTIGASGAGGLCSVAQAGVQRGWPVPMLWVSLILIAPFRTRVDI